jgi:hypothetical protein
MDVRIGCTVPNLVPRQLMLVKRNNCNRLHNASLLRGLLSVILAVVVNA